MYNTLKQGKNINSICHCECNEAISYRLPRTKVLAMTGKCGRSTPTLSSSGLSWGSILPLKNKGRLRGVFDLFKTHPTFPYALREGQIGRSTPAFAGMTAALLLGLLFSIPSFAYTSCVGGTEITSKVYGTTDASSYCTSVMCPSPAKTFCKSDKSMNWWTAFNWCKSNGGTLASFASMCPGITTSPNNVTGACPALHGVGGSQWVWSSMGYGSSHALFVNLSSGAVNGSYYYRTNSNDLYALCE